MKHFDSVILSLIYTLGHVIIAGVTVYALTGSTIWEAGLVALVEIIYKWTLVLYTS